MYRKSGRLKSRFREPPLDENSPQRQAWDDQFEQNHHARIVEDAVNRLDAEELKALYRGVGSLAYPPDLMLKIALFEYLRGRTSPAQWHRDAKEHDALKWLGRSIQPSRSAWYEFRDRMDRVIHDLNDDLVRDAVQEGLAAPGDAAQDGTTFRSNASRHQAFNQETLQKRKAKVDAVVEADQQQTPAEPQPKWMPKTVGGRLDLQARMETAQQHLDGKLLENRRKMKSQRRLEKNIVVSLTDPAAPFARDKEKTFCFLYTTQFMVDAASLLVLNYSVAAENTDVGTLAPMIDRVQPLIGGTLERVSVDAGYTSLLDLIDCRDRDIDLLGPVQSNSFTAKKQAEKGVSRITQKDFIWLEDEQTFQCPQGHKFIHEYQERLKRHAGRHVISHRYRCPPEFCTACPLKDLCAKNPATGRTVKRLEGQELIDAQREKMQRDEIKAVYRQRGQTVERPFADAKRNRSFGRFHGRGLDRARAEVGLLVMAQNLLTIHRLRKRNETPEKQAA